MKNAKSPNLVVRSGLALGLVLALGAPARMQAAEPADGMMKMEGLMGERCQKMKAHKQKMMTEMNAQDAELTTQVAAMNSAPDGRKPGLMAAIVTRLLEQRIARDAHKARMEEEMMQHMMQHMQRKEAMSQCPMMKGMEEKPGDAPKAGQ